MIGNYRRENKLYYERRLITVWEEIGNIFKENGYERRFYMKEDW